MRVAILLLAVPVVALLSTVWLPFVNEPKIWLGMPSVLTWTAGWVVLLTPALANVEYQRNRAAANGGDR
ncbi:hypothetical protein [Yinghuangia seranimata]|uniref:hypothetical protein n=1 Tax=Yinghuangia seranimata TaxID=408067 RepID=UPI00248CA7A8|nr:hypothetical protein [Yinghuangia seranimata]MDI2128451.1 hypothetical protein [Yinghuangia seranimata]